MDPQIQRIRQLLLTVTDPEIPVLTLDDLGVIRDIVIDGKTVIVKITPTYTGCPATDYMAVSIKSVLQDAGYEQVTVQQVIAPAWTTDWLSDAGRQKLKDYGIAPPVGTSDKAIFLEDITVACPQCESLNTKVLSSFGSTACKALYQCQDCREPFDYFKCH